MVPLYGVPIVGPWALRGRSMVLPPWCPDHGSTVSLCSVYGVSMGGLQCLYDLSLVGHGSSGVGPVHPSSGGSMVGPRRVHGAPVVGLRRLHGGSEVDR